MAKMLAVEPKRCTNCRLCELACSMKKAGEFSPLKSRIRVNSYPEAHAYIPLACFQCSDAPCVAVCPSGALAQGQGLVAHDPDRCIGCRMCMLACPFGVMSFDSTRGVTVKCDTCGGDPECVRFCAPGALEYREADSSHRGRSRDFSRTLVEALRG
jgi:anaerobic carbon-monoxide dehydrogenase iron sulfur subunit